MIGHPRATTLARYTDDTLSPRRKRRIAAHLADCPACRSVLMRQRDVIDAARALSVPELPADTFAHVIRRRAAGERIILPHATIASTARRRPLRVAAAAAALLLPLSAIALLSTREASASRSELRLQPDRPGTGARVEVEYRPAGPLADEEVLVLRARLRTPADEWENWQALHTRVATLRRDGSAFRGSFRLPDSTVYAVFAVEDTSGARIDANGEQWELLVHDADGRPLYDALAQKHRDADRRDTRRSLDALRALTSTYPDRIDGWLQLAYKHVGMLGEAAFADSAAPHRARVERLAASLASAARPDPDEMVALVAYAELTGSDSIAGYWRRRLLAEHPANPGVIDIRIGLIVDSIGTDPSDLLVAYEGLWRDAGQRARAVSLAISGIRMADMAGDGAGVLRWTARLREARGVAWDGTATAYLLRHVASNDEVRAQALRHGSQSVGYFLGYPERERPLDRPVPDHRAIYRGYAGRVMAGLAEAHLLDADTAAARAAIAEAVSMTWNARLFRSAADLRLAVGDTAGALPMLARVAVDPETQPAFADSVRLRVGRWFEGETWRATRAAAEAELRDHFLLRARTQGLPSGIEVASADGSSTSLPVRGSVTVIALWSANCPRAVSELGPLQATATRLESRGVRVALVSGDAPSESVHALLREHGVRVPVFFDTRSQARAALDEWGYPTYFVVDDAGQVRFQNFTLDDVTRQAAALQLESQRTAAP